MASFVAPVLGLGAGAALYNFGYQGQYKEDVAVASTAAITVFAVLAVASRVLNGPTVTASSSGETKKKKKNKTKKVAVAESDDSDSPNTEKASKPKGDAGSAKGNKAEKPTKAAKTESAAKVEKTEKASKGKEEKKEATTQQPDKKGNAKAKVAETSKVEQKASGKDVKKGGEPAAKEAKKGDASKEAKKGQAAKPVETKKAKKDVASDSDDEEAFLRLGQKNTGLLASSSSRAPVKQAESDDDEDSDEDDAPVKAELSNSKSAIRRRKQKENKEKSAAAAAAAESFTKPKKAVVDNEGFETVRDKRSAKKPVTAATASAAVSESKTETKAAASVASAPVNFSDTIELESKQIALLVGPKGETMNALKEACGGNIRIDTPLRDTGDKKVTVSGDEASVKYCLKQIRELITKGYCSALSPGLASSTMTVPGSALGILVGPKGSNIHKIQETFGIKIKTPDRGSNSEQITISGPKDAIKKAKAVINQLIEHGFSSVTHEGYEVGEVAFPRAELRHLIGPGGHTIKSIQGDTKTKVKIPTEDAENQNIQVIGPADGVAKAIKQISTLLERKAAKEAAAADAAAYNSEDDGY